ncbi:MULTISPECIES: phosphatidylserine decarboxylase [Psychrilyobacter]|uniref:Phosphatidylserine decarboxylase proenzyme n=1 Tax=Psychrilyobacter piezotolerans TaxID=2293438 RepID=A0ABX9KCX6_9FUSO|nr:MULTISPECIES: phosphatidylserine decarboxylase [Psychrilyobacter]MCS5421915.1 phosphatidylserine decarboxylase [Psychrilyobacter sp. S5]NDI79243.1 phosphatidylserine decarboxylase [Psychrilyobacter piezotolerans]RDE58827.1 phosphatidylserine decarboxylase [Psychrilyobacter sp. S5]REI39323.1 phosphatidylserine decarboxylase [Psychrilyobacter piezotolerans]
MKLDKIEYIDRKTNMILVENVPGENFLKFLYHNPFGKLPLELLVKRKCLSSFYGKLMDQKKSINKIEDFVKNNHIDMNESQKKVGDFTSFNDFFYRKLKPNARKIEDGLVSPADGKAVGFEKINDWDKFFVKGSEFCLEKYLNNKELLEKYKGGSMIIVRLAPADYHRYHFPADGKIGSRNKIDGYYYSVSPYAIKENFGVFCENKRELTTLETSEYGDVLISEIGATMVGGIEQTYTPDTHVKKGEEKGYFTFGGSSVLLLFEKGKVMIDDDILKNTKNGYETKVYMGEKIGE